MGHRPRVTVAKPAGDGAGAARGPAEGRIPARRLTKRRSLRLPCCAECAFPLRRGGIAGTECAFPLCRRPGGVGHNPPPACGALWKVAQLGKRARATPRQAGGGLRRGPAGLGLGPGASRKSAAWAEGLAESAPRVGPGHHQAASCGLRGCRELSITSLALSAPPRPLSRELRAMGVDTRFPAPSAPPTPLVPPSGADVVKTLIEAGFRWPYEVNTG